MILEYKGINIFFTDTGSGPAVVLLHGFLENLRMWDEVIPRLSKRNRVIAIDLLGHGQTPCLGYAHSMPDQADMVYAVLKSLKLRKYILIGHSMGGYIALAFSKAYPEHIKALCLMNSTFEADDAERVQLRTRANKMVSQNFDNMVRMSFSNLFSSASKIQYKKTYEDALNQALKTPVQGYIAGQEGMKIRADFTGFFTQAPFKKLILLGKKDPVIDANRMLEYCRKHQIPHHIFSEGHMSHIENLKEFLHIIVHFVEKT